MFIEQQQQQQQQVDEIDEKVEQKENSEWLSKAQSNSLLANTNLFAY